MTTLIIPYTMASDTYVNSGKIDANFAAVSDFINCSSGGLEQANLAGVTFRPACLDEPCAVFWETLVVNRALGTPNYSTLTRTIMAFENIRLHELRLAVSKSNTSNAVVNAAVLPSNKVASQYFAKSIVPTGRGTVTYDDSKGTNVAMASFTPALEFPSDSLPVLYMASSTLTSNVTVAVLQAKFSAMHTSR